MLRELRALHNMAHQHHARVSELLDGDAPTWDNLGFFGKLGYYRVAASIRYQFRYGFGWDLLHWVLNRLRKGL